MKKTLLTMCIASLAFCAIDASAQNANYKRSAGEPSPKVQVKKPTVNNSKFTYTKATPEQIQRKLDAKKKFDNSKQAGSLQAEFPNDPVLKNLDGKQQYSEKLKAQKKRTPMRKAVVAKKPILIGKQ